ncbi:MAG TPA: hypothetical protein VIQ78_13195 [Terrimesophilobacter sp.]|jgi:Predicted membrane protein|uniref:membrane protein YczE n=1 Tax=Terrimesophilobacter sp. TaxID=2906435 RepID=UPI002F9303E9
MSQSLVLTRRWVQLLLGLGIYGIAIAMMIRAAVGISPWDVLAQGIALRTGIPFGLVTNIVGGIVLLLWIPLRQRLGVGTILNALLIGPSAEVGLWLIPEQSNIWMQLLLFTGGLILLAIATGLYIGARFGPGPRDGLMTGINKKFGIRIWIVRTSIEVVVLGIGWLLGGNVGFGTLAFALLIGPMVHVTMPLLHVSDKRSSDKRSPDRHGPESPLTPEPAASPAENR